MRRPRQPEATTSIGGLASKVTYPIATVGYRRYDPRRWAPHPGPDREVDVLPFR